MYIFGIANQKQRRRKNSSKSKSPFIYVHAVLNDSLYYMNFETIRNSHEIFIYSFILKFSFYSQTFSPKVILLLSKKLLKECNTYSQYQGNSVINMPALKNIC